MLSHPHFNRAGALVGMGIPEYKAKKYQGRLQKGGILVAVHCETDEEVNRARQVFLAQGAQDIATRVKMFQETQEAA